MIVIIIIIIINNDSVKCLFAYNIFSSPNKSYVVRNILIDYVLDIKQILKKKLNEG